MFAHAACVHDCQVTITGLLYRFGGNLRYVARDWMRVQLTWYTGPDQVQACAALPHANEIAFHGGIKCRMFLYEWRAGWL